MRVLIASAEAVPFAKVGGLADVVGSLPVALRAAGVDARVVMPGYGFIEHLKYRISRLFTFRFTHRNGASDVEVYTCLHEGVPIYFIQAWPYFGTDSTVYTTYNWDMPRFIFFNQVVMAFIWELDRRIDWFPDVVQGNDWHTALLPFMVANARNQPEWAGIATAFTIHNIAYQGDWAGGFLWQAGIAGRDHGLLNHSGLSDNLMAIAIAYSDIITTVSPRYAQEIQHGYAGYNLAPLIQARQDDLIGILNGLDTQLWDPETDSYLIANYSARSFEEQRIVNKRHLQSYARLPVREDVPLIAMVTRLTWQKGIDLAIPALRRLLEDTDVQVIVLGTGDAEYESALYQLNQDYKWKMTAFLEFDAALSQHIYAGSDLFLMPSHFEPCGIGQMIAMRYGSLPVVRETGGLADTVQNYDDADADAGTGFVFQWEESDAVLGTLRWAIDTYYNRPKAWRRLQRRAMEQDFSWQLSAQKYIDLYNKAIMKRKGTRLES